jgi:hypothetical protein
VGLRESGVQLFGKICARNPQSRRTLCNKRARIFENTRLQVDIFTSCRPRSLPRGHRTGLRLLSGALTGVTGISGTQGPTVQNTSNIAGILGSSDTVNGVIGTSNRSIGVVGFSNNVGVFGQSTNPASFAGLFAGNVQVTGTLSAAVKNAVVPFPDGSKRVLHCMESPEHWFEDCGTAKLQRGRTVVRLDADFAKVIKRTTSAICRRGATMW